MSTDAIDEIVHNLCVSHGVYPSPLYYNKFPKSCCTSLNEVLCHGVPELDLILREGDVINIDITIFYKGLHLDCSETVLVLTDKSKLDLYPKELQLIIDSRQALLEGVKGVRLQQNFNGIGREIENFVRSKGKYTILKNFCGHG